MVIKRKCQGWYHHSHDTLTPILESRSEVLHTIRFTKYPPSATMLSKFRRLQHKVDEDIEIAKTGWSRHRAQTIHNMTLQTKKAWANIILLSAGEKIHHSSTHYIHMRLPFVDLAENDEENVRVFAEHSSKVLSNHKNTEDNVIKKILLQKVMTELDKVTTWEEFMNAVTKIINNKSPGLNSVPSNAFKTVSETNLIHHFNFILEFWEDILDYVEWHDGQVIPFPKSGDPSDHNKIERGEPDGHRSKSFHHYYV